MGRHSTAFLTWLISLINPPPLKSMTHFQKTARIALITATLVVTSILLSMVAAAGIFALQHERDMAGGWSQLMADIAIILVSMIVNTLCVLVLLKIKNADQKLIPPTAPPVQTGEDRK